MMPWEIFNKECHKNYQILKGLMLYNFITVIINFN